jgi:hypothetical protein
MRAITIVSILASCLLLTTTLTGYLPVRGSEDPRALRGFRSRSLRCSVRDEKKERRSRNELSTETGIDMAVPLCEFRQIIAFRP